MRESTLREMDLFKISLPRKAKQTAKVSAGLWWNLISSRVSTFCSNDRSGCCWAVEWGVLGMGVQHPEGDLPAINYSETALHYITSLHQGNSTTKSTSCNRGYNQTCSNEGRENVLEIQPLNCGVEEMHRTALLQELVFEAKSGSQ